MKRQINPNRLIRTNRDYSKEPLHIGEVINIADLEYWADYFHGNPYEICRYFRGSANGADLNWLTQCTRAYNIAIKNCKEFPEYKERCKKALAKKYATTRDFSKEPLNRGEIVNPKDLAFWAEKLERNPYKICQYFRGSSTDADLIWLQNCAKAYGIEVLDGRKCPEFIENRKAYYEDKYGSGITNCMQVKEVQEQRRKTCNEIYGGEPLANKEVQQKARATLKQNYGVEYPAESPELRQRALTAIRKRYGVGEDVTNISQIEEVQENKRRNLAEKYGENVTSVFQIPGVKEKSLQTMSETYGVEYAAQSEQLMNKRKTTNLQLYGVEQPCQNVDVSKQARITKYKNTTTLSDEEINILIKILDNKVLCEKYLKEKSSENGEKWMTLQNISNDLQCSSSTLEKILYEYDLIDYIYTERHRSTAEVEISAFFKNKNFIVIDNDRKVLKRDGKYPLEIDIYLPEYKVGIEYDGTYWHSDAFLLEHDGVTYEEDCQIKDNIAKRNGIEIIHIKEEEYEYSNKEEFLNNLLKFILEKYKKI